MALPFINRAAQQKRQVMAVDLGSRVTKAVCVERRGQGFALSRYALMDTPIFEKSLSPDLLSEHLKAVALALNARTRQVALAVGANDAFVRQLELPPRIAVDDVRSVLKHNAKTYLQQDLSNHVVDCHVIYEAIPQSSAAAKTPVGGHKQKVLITAAKKQFVEDFAEGIRRAGLTADAIVPGLIGPVNVFEQAMPEVFEKDVVALVDLGFRGSSRR
jgi:Tfp pilus assembly PilM family ATPase